MADDGGILFPFRVVNFRAIVGSDARLRFRREYFELALSWILIMTGVERSASLTKWKIKEDATRFA